jgi:hypothetical protein
MTAAKPTTDDLRMSGEEFDRIMRKALQVKPEGTPKAKRRPKPKATRAKKRPAK